MAKTFDAGSSDMVQVCSTSVLYCFTCRAFEKECVSIVRRYAELGAPYTYIVKMCGVAGNPTFRLEIWSWLKSGVFSGEKAPSVDGVDKRLNLEWWRDVVYAEWASFEPKVIEIHWGHPCWEDLQREMSDRRGSVVSLAITKMWMNFDGEVKLMRDDRPGSVGPSLCQTGLPKSIDELC